MDFGTGFYVNLFGGYSLFFYVGIFWPGSRLDWWFHVGTRERWPLLLGGRRLSHLILHACLRWFYIDVQVGKESEE
jgi:hypothetical protein